MVEIVQKQPENGINVQDLCKTFGMEEEEVIRLANRVGIPKSAVIAENSFGKAWQPN